jgi:four helix bundle protein
MGDFKDYTDLDVWNESRNLVKQVYLITQTFPKEEVYGLSSQIKRAAVSIPSNIAEGCGRNHIKDAMQFFYISRGSIFELETQLYLAFDLNFISEDELNNILEKIKTCKKLINGFINYNKKKL